MRRSSSSNNSTNTNNSSTQGIAIPGPPQRQRQRQSTSACSSPASSCSAYDANPQSSYSNKSYSKSKRSSHIHSQRSQLQSQSHLNSLKSTPTPTQNSLSLSPSSSYFSTETSDHDSTAESLFSNKSNRIHTPPDMANFQMPYSAHQRSSSPFAFNSYPSVSLSHPHSHRQTYPSAHYHINNGYNRTLHNNTPASFIDSRSNSNNSSSGLSSISSSSSSKSDSIRSSVFHAKVHDQDDDYDDDDGNDDDDENDDDNDNLDRILSQDDDRLDLDDDKMMEPNYSSSISSPLYHRRYYASKQPHQQQQYQPKHYTSQNRKPFPSPCESDNNNSSSKSQKSRVMKQQKETMLVPSSAHHHKEGQQSLVFMIGRYPLLLVLSIIMLFDLIFMFIIRILVYAWERGVTWRGKKKKLREFMRWTQSYQEWQTAANLLDDYLGYTPWKSQNQDSSTTDSSSSLFNFPLIRKTITRLQRIRGRIEDLSLNSMARNIAFDDDVDGGVGVSEQIGAHSSSGNGITTESMIKDEKRVLLKLLSDHALKRHHGGISNESLYSQCYSGTMEMVDLFYEEVLKGIETVGGGGNGNGEFDGKTALSLEERRVFLENAKKNYGRTALCLSGGAGLAFYHLGVLKALFEQNLLPDVITGSSAGSLMAALVCCRTDEEIIQHGVFDPHFTMPKFFSDPWSVRIERYLKEGYLFCGMEGFHKFKDLTNGHLTFMEAYKRTGRILCIPVVPDEKVSTTPTKVLNYITAPDVVISSAIVASSAIPGLLPPFELLCKTESGDFVPFRGSGKRWRDGSIRTDIPDLHVFNVAFTIVSQVNPHITVFFYQSQGSAGEPTSHRSGRGWRGGFLASTLIHALDLDLKKWLHLIRDLRLLPPIASTDVSSVFLQQFQGSTTILPRTGLGPRGWLFGGDLEFVMNDPTPGYLETCLRSGELATWPKIQMVRHRMSVEMRLKKLEKELEIEMNGRIYKN